jgi:hypothetical protein
MAKAGLANVYLQRRAGASTLYDMAVDIDYVSNRERKP